jgi:hypothetical protein
MFLKSFWVISLFTGNVKIGIQFHMWNDTRVLIFFEKQKI